MLILCHQKCHEAHHDIKHRKRSFSPKDTISNQKIQETNDHFYDKFMIVAE